MDIVESNESNYRVREAVNTLNTVLRTTIVLFYYNELSICEIAQAMSCFEGTVKSRLHYARKKLQMELARYYEPVYMPEGFNKSREMNAHG